MEAPQSRSDHDVGLELLSEYVFCHLNSMNDKFNTLIEMIHKLFAFVSASAPSLSNCVSRRTYRLSMASLGPLQYCSMDALFSLAEISSSGGDLISLGLMDG